PEFSRSGNALQQRMQNKSIADQRGRRSESSSGDYTIDCKCAYLCANCAGQHDHDRRQDTKPCQARASEYDGCPSDSIVDSLIGVRILKRACLKALERQQPKYQVRQTNEQKSKEQNKRDIPKKAARSTVINHCTSSLYLSICGMVPP